MAQIRPFRALYYDAEKVGDVGKVIAPPYDVIDETQRRQLLASHPHNIVRLILPDDPENPVSWQERAASTYLAWRGKGVFREHHRESLYLYRQSFALPDGRRHDRLALIALYRLEEPGKGEIYPHERTFPQVTEEQLSLLRCCQANFSQVFALFRDGNDYRRILREKALGEGRELLSFRFPADTLNELIALEDAGLQRELASMIGESGVFIADGHHRYETALLYRQECRRNAGDPEEDLPCDYLSMAFVGIKDPGLVLLPVHRLLSGTGKDAREMVEILASSGQLDEVKKSDWVESAQGVLELVTQNKEEAPIFGVVTRGHAYVFRPFESGGLRVGASGEEKDQPQLDVTILHRKVLRDILGLEEVGTGDGGGFAIRYTVDLREVMEAVSSGRAEIAFLQRSPSVEQAWQLSTRGLKMPHKSTYFFPKMPSGLVVYDHRVFLSTG